jgi:DNA polymerase elongation subunit (family B)
VYPKNKKLDAFNIENLIENLGNYIPANFKKKNTEEFVDSDSETEEEEEDDDEKDDEDTNKDINDLNQEITTSNFKRKKKVKLYNKKDATLIDLIKDDKCEYNTKLYELTEAFSNTGFPELEGDIITFIGLSFINYTEAKPYKRIIIVKGGCKIPDKYLLWAQENSVIVLERNTEKDVLLTFTKLINSENPHIITGYNITGFDFEFMYNR